MLRRVVAPSMHSYRRRPRLVLSEPVDYSPSVNVYAYARLPLLLRETFSLSARSRRLVILIIRLFEEEVGGQFLVLVASEVGLDDLVPREAESAQPLNGIALLLGDLDGSCARGNSAFTFTTFL